MFVRSAKTLTRLRECAGRSESSLAALTLLQNPTRACPPHTLRGQRTHEPPKSHEKPQQPDAPGRSNE
ncbi:MAG: hypothetical protein N0C90_09760 [Candidatus Thiodiazotropha endolucinida]|nr:hypothetical protein [Candidatus Thiodiazotropha taylori]MCW4261645.1 hypothetical protein [Candidatus Thiodiazotropha endolucinida]